MYTRKILSTLSVVLGTVLFSSAVADSGLTQEDLTPAAPALVDNSVSQTSSDQMNQQPTYNHCCKPVNTCCKKPNYCPIPCCDERVPVCFNQVVYVYGDFLWWSTNYNILMSTDLNAATGTLTGGRPRLHWTAGGRAGIGFNSGYDHWDVEGSYTYYRNHTSKNASIPFSGGTLPLPITAKLRALLSMGDLELGRSYFMSPKVAIHPLVGVRGGILNQKNNATLTMFNSNGTTSDTPITLNWKNWGVGPKIGIKTNWGSFNGLSILGNIQAAFLFGKGKTYLNVLGGDPFGAGGASGLTIKDKYWQIMPNIQTQLGLAWNHCFNCGMNSVKASVAWETDYFWQGTNVVFFDRALSMQGLTVELALGF